MNNIFLSKSSYCKCIQCPKIIWLKKYKPEQAVQTVNPIIFENGKKVGIVAQDLLEQNTKIFIIIETILK